MPNSFRLSGTSDSLRSLFSSNGCWPSWRTTDEETLSEKSEEYIEPELTAIENLEYGADEDKTLRSLRNEGYNVMMEFFHTIEKANQKLITAQWQQFDKELYDLRMGGRELPEMHLSPNDIKPFGENYGSLPDQLLEVLQLINTPDSPFRISLPRLAKANDKIPSHTQEQLPKYPSIQRCVEKNYDRSKLERMLDTPLTKIGGKNPLSTEKLDALIKQLENYLPWARELDDVNHYTSARFERTDHVVDDVEDLQADLQVILDKLQAYEAKKTGESMALLCHGGKA